VYRELQDAYLELQQKAQGNLTASAALQGGGAGVRQG
jgi:hypothetical protein